MLRHGVVHLCDTLVEVRFSSLRNARLQQSGQGSRVKACRYGIVSLDHQGASQRDNTKMQLNQPQQPERIHLDDDRVDTTSQTPFDDSWAATAMTR